VKVAVCDYGAGNVRSVIAAFGRLGADAFATRERDEVLTADLAVLPGVGSAAHAMRGLRAHGLDSALRERVDADGPTLGICLGLQLALEESEEDGGVPGLGLLPGRAVRLRDGRVPRIGWAPVEPGGEAFYFAHSYAADTPAATGRSEGIVASAEAGSFLGVQFHPEKSGAAGARFLARCLSRA
jgi:imidazole glycerol phosphate synthase glutamine amidotransferase subunit